MSGTAAETEEAVDYDPGSPALEIDSEAVVADEPEAPEAAEDSELVDTAEEMQATAAEEGGPGPSKLSSTDPNDPMSLPPHGTEIFIGGIPKSATEAQIKEFAEKVGEVHSVKLAKDPVNADQNRGFGFVRYLLREGAEAAKEKLHGTELTGTSAKVRVSSSQSKHRVYLGNIPRAWTKEQLLDELNKNVKGLDSMDLVMSKEAADQNRGFAFLTFFNHECAAAGKEFLSKPSYNIEGRQLTVSYAEPKHSEVQQQQQQQQQATQPVKAVYVGNLPPGATEEQLKEIFSKWGEVSKVMIPPATEKRPEQRFCFVHFSEQAPTDKAVADAKAGVKPELNGNVLEVKPAKPQVTTEQSSTPGGRGLMRAGRGGRAMSPRGRGGRFGRGGMHGRAGYGAYGGHEEAFWGYDQGFDAGYDMYGAGGMPMAAPAAMNAGMTMVPMMLPSGQVGYVLQTADAGAAYGGYAATGPDRSYREQGSDMRRGRGRGRGPPRYRPY